MIEKIKKECYDCGGICRLEGEDMCCGLCGSVFGLTASARREFNGKE